MPNPPTPPTNPIFIYVSRNGNSTNIKVRDSEGHIPGNDNITTDVVAGSELRWEVDPAEPTIYSITNIERKVEKTDPEDANLIATGPSWVAPVGSTEGYWSATIISPSPGKDKRESYTIYYKITSNGPVLNDDPKIQMQS